MEGKVLIRSPLQRDIHFIQYRFTKKEAAKVLEEACEARIEDQE